MAATASQNFADNLTKILPTLKSGLEVVEGPRSHFGAPTAIVYDPTSNEHFRFDWKAATMLRFWQPGLTVMELCQALTLNTTANIHPDMVVKFIETLDAYNLIVHSQETYNPTKHEIKPDYSMTGILKHYFYWRIPLVNPDKALEAILPFIKPLINKVSLYILIALGLIGLWLVVNQWEAYWATLPYIFTTSGMLIAFISIVLVKCLHEMGHGIITKYFNRPVTTMGVAFLFMFPILYTDTSHASTIRDKKQRMAIDAAGVGMEILIAIIATYAWLLTDDGPLRSAFFMISSTTWLFSLFINLNPLMKFDGYYLLSDHWNIPNLQSRALAITQWKIRRFFVNWPGKKPENFPPKQELKLQIYACLSLIYRLLIFISISLGVYAFFFKALGIFLVLLNLVWLLVLPLGQELFIWWKASELESFKTRKKAWAVGSVLALMVFFYPTSKVIEAPAIMMPKQMSLLYAPEAALLKVYPFEQGALVEKGQTIIELTSPELIGMLDIETSRQKEMELSLKASSVSSLLVQARKRLEQELRLAHGRVKSIQDKIETLTVKAPFTGQLLWLEDHIKPNDWVKKDEAMALLAVPADTEIKAYIEEANWARFNACETTLFYPSDPQKSPIEVNFTAQSALGGNELKDNYFASIYGGEIAVRKDDQGRLIADTAIQELLFTPAEATAPLAAPMKGIVRLCAAPKSFASSFVDAFYIIFVKELGF